MKDAYSKPAAEPRGDIVSVTLGGNSLVESGGDAKQPIGGARLTFGL